MEQINDYQFRGQRESEKVLFVARQHPYVLARSGLYILFLVLVVIAALAWFGASGVTSWIVFMSVLLIVLIGYYNWFLWWNGSYILTTQRIVISDQVSLVHRKISEAELDRIQDVTCETKGVVHTMLNIGTIRIQTASSERIIEIDKIYNPYDMQQRIVTAQKKTGTPARKLI